MRAITHRACRRQRECRMEGDTFEMEDQRNWSDASYKTYVRPLALPWPYQMPAKRAVRQQISLTITRHAAQLRAIAPDRRELARHPAHAR